MSASADPKVFIESLVQNLPLVRRLEVVCSPPLDSAHVQRRYVHHSIFREGAQWPDSTEVLCFHCIHRFGGRPIFLPTEYRTERAEYVGWGVFCHPSCAKAYSIEHHAYNAPHQMLLLAQLASELGYEVPVRPAPPQCRLKVLGGDLDIADFRASCGRPLTHIVHRPPFVVSAMAFEESQPMPWLHDPRAFPGSAAASSLGAQSLNNTEESNLDINAEADDKDTGVLHEGAYEQFVKKMAERKQKEPDSSTSLSGVSGSLLKAPTRPKKAEGGASNSKKPRAQTITSSTDREVKPEPKETRGLMAFLQRKKANSQVD